MIEKLAFFLGRNDEGPNIDLAVELVKTKDRDGIGEIAEGLRNPDSRIANDCIKVLYEIGEREPALIAGYSGDFLRLLLSKNNRMVWGAMTALGTMAALRPKEIFENLDAVVKAYERGSVITVDNAISVFAGLARSGPEYGKAVFPLIIRHLATCRPREVAQHAERAFACVTESNADEFGKVLRARRDALSEPQKKRVDRLLRNMEKAFG